MKKKEKGEQVKPKSENKNTVRVAAVTLTNIAVLTKALLKD